LIVPHLKLVAAVDVVDPADFAIEGTQETTAQLLAALERGRGSIDRDLALRAAQCIRELIDQKEQATELMLESSALLKTALTRLHALRALI
jgi:aminoglycoside phosphotransferase